MTAQEISSQPEFRGPAKANNVPVARLIGFEAKDIGDGPATVTLSAGPQHANPMGTLHGGILCDVADAFTTVELKINFFRPVWQAPLRAEGTVVQRGHERA